MVKTLLIDTNSPTIDFLKERLSDFPEIEVIGITKEKDALVTIKDMKPDLVFVDADHINDDTKRLFTDISENKLKCFVVVISHTGEFNVVDGSNISAFLSLPIKNNDIDSLLKDISNAFHSRLGNPLNNQLDSPHREHLLIYLNSEDFSIVSFREIGLFQFNCKCRVWEVIIAGHDKPVKLKRNENRWSILSLDPTFVQVNQKYIINSRYLKKVENNRCILKPPFDKLDYIKVGTFFKKKLVERYYVL